MKPLYPETDPVNCSMSWWLTVKPSESMTARALEHRDRMASDKEGRKVPDQIDGQYIGLLRPIK
jgi:hypothetical protein